MNGMDCESEGLLWLFITGGVGGVVKKSSLLMKMKMQKHQECLGFLFMELGNHHCVNLVCHLLGMGSWIPLHLFATTE